MTSSRNVSLEDAVEQYCDAVFTRLHTTDFQKRKAYFKLAILLVRENLLEHNGVEVPPLPKDKKKIVKEMLMKSYDERKSGDGVLNANFNNVETQMCVKGVVEEKVFISWNGKPWGAEGKKVATIRKGGDDVTAMRGGRDVTNGHVILDPAVFATGRTEFERVRSFAKVILLALQALSAGTLTFSKEKRIDDRLRAISGQRT
eukprot:g2337.t1